MHILFVYVGLPIGGIETLLVRLSKSLSDAGARVSVLFATHHADPGLLAQLGEHARIAYFDQFLPSGPWGDIQGKPLLRFVLPLNAKALREWLQDTPDVCHAPDTGSLLMAARLRAVVDIGHLTAGVYHDREYLFEDYKCSTFVRTSADIFRSLSPEQLVFFNESSVRVHSQRFDKDYSSSTLTPIGIDTAILGKRTLGRKSNRVVSIGRLTPFKTYSGQMVEVIARLRTKGYILQYDIYGTGECEQSLRNQIARLNLQDQVHLKGAISYEQMSQALEGSLAFVGSGTALIEASAAGVPAIVGIEHAADASTYGFLHNITGLSYHDADLPFPLTTFDTCLMELIKGTEAAFAEHAARAKVRAQDFSLESTTRSFLNLGERTQNTPRNLRPIGVCQSVMLNASMMVLRWRALRDRTRYFDRHSSVTPN